MTTDEAPQDAAFRAEARQWLTAHATPRRDTAPADRSGWRDPSPEIQMAHVDGCKTWQRTLFDAGWAGVAWPSEYGGRGGTPAQQRIFNQEQAAFEVSVGSLTVALGMVVPTLMTWGSEEQKRRFVAPILSGDELWCQLFSEPGAGSDLAGLSTRAERVDGGWLVNGQKVWTSGAHHSQWGILLVRTNTDAPKRHGITYLLLDMATPGVEVRPLRQIDGIAHFNEVFLTDVRIPDDCLVGQVDEGWKVAQTTLQSERVAIGGGDGVRFDDLRALAETRSDGRFRQDLAEAYVRSELLRYLGLRVQTAISQGRAPGAESSVMKLAYSQHVAETADLVLSLEGPAAMLGVAVAPDNGYWQQQFLSQWMTRLGGGTDQIQRNIIAERVLGLPRELEQTTPAPV